LRAANMGYWLDQDVAGRGIMPISVALVGDYAVSVLKLHRLEINLRPENYASRRVVVKLGFDFEGMRANYLHIDGEWRDHDCFVLNSTSHRPELMARLKLWPRADS
jgi:ribosomal-protein-alanine N-acetyltransferase